MVFLVSGQNISKHTCMKGYSYESCMAAVVDDKNVSKLNLFTWGLAGVGLMEGRVWEDLSLDWNQYCQIRLH